MSFRRTSAAFMFVVFVVQLVIPLRHLAGILPQGNPGPRDRLRTVFLTVRDNQNRIVADLQKQELRLLVSGHEQNIEWFGPDTEIPLLLGLLVDVSGSRRYPMRGDEEEPASELFRAALTRDDIGFVVSFSDDVTLEVEPTPDAAVLVRGVRRVAQGERKLGTALFDALYATCTSEAQGQPRRRALVVVSDFADNASRKRLSDVIEIALRTETAIYPIVLEGNQPLFPNPPGVRIQIRSPKEAKSAALEMAERTGARSFLIKKPADLRTAMGEIALELRRQYILGYSVPEFVAGDQLLPLHIRTTRKDTKLTFRKAAYFPLPDKAPQEKRVVRLSWC